MKLATQLLTFFALSFSLATVSMTKATRCPFTKVQAPQQAADNTSRNSACASEVFADERRRTGEQGMAQFIKRPNLSRNIMTVNIAVQDKSGQ